MVKTIHGPHSDLRSVRAPSSIMILNIQGVRIESLAGIERFKNVHTVSFEKARVDDLAPLVALEPTLRKLTIHEPPTSIDIYSLFQLSGLEDLWVIDPDDLDSMRRLAEGPFQRLPRLTSLTLRTSEDHCIDIGAAWFPQLTELDRVYFSNLGIRVQDTDAVCQAGTKLRRLSFKSRSAEQTAAIVHALGPQVVDTWEPPQPQHGEILELEGTLIVSLGFPRADSGMDQEIAARRLLDGRWSDLAPDVDMDQGGDAVYFSSRRRDVLEELIRRAEAARLIE